MVGGAPFPTEAETGRHGDGAMLLDQVRDKLFLEVVDEEGNLQKVEGS